MATGNFRSTKDEVWNMLRRSRSDWTEKIWLATLRRILDISSASAVILPVNT